MNSVKKIKHKAFDASVVFYRVRKSFVFFFFVHIIRCQESLIQIEKGFSFYSFYHGRGGKTFMVPKY